MPDATPWLKRGGTRLLKKASLRRSLLNPQGLPLGEEGFVAFTSFLSQIREMKKKLVGHFSFPNERNEKKKLTKELSK